jgi:hypothetical protein
MSIIRGWIVVVINCESLVEKMIDILTQLRDEAQPATLVQLRDDTLEYLLPRVVLRDSRSNTNQKIQGEVQGEVILKDDRTLLQLRFNRLTPCRRQTKVFNRSLF